MRSYLFSVLSVLVLCFPANAHEFWIEPTSYQVDEGDTVIADLKNGEEFEGVSLAWFDRNFTRFDMIVGNETRPVTARLGDTPAMNTVAWSDGLMIIVHETTPASLTYSDWAKFMRFAAHKDFPNAENDHTANGWSKESFRESYTRHVKALVAVGAGSGQDRLQGLETEIIALTNPYDTEFDGQMRVKVTYQGTPRANAQVEVFEKTSQGSVNITLYRTNEDGLATVPVTPGNSYLFDAVVLRPNAQAGTSDNAPVWETLWAALTFAVPAQD